MSPLLIFAIAFFAASEPSQPTPASETRSIHPDADYYPERALRLEKEGRVLLSCEVSSEGFLSNCIVIEETPKDFGFGEAAIRRSAYFKMLPPRGGTNVSGTRVQIPVDFTLP